MKKKRLQLPASRLSANKRFLNKFARMNSTVKLLTRGGRGDARLFLERDQKRDQGKSKALEISSAKFFLPPSTRLFLKWLILRHNETQDTRLGFLFLLS